MSTAMVSPRHRHRLRAGYGVLKRLGATPPGRPGARSALEDPQHRGCRAAAGRRPAAGRAWVPLEPRRRRARCAVAGAIGAVLLGSAAFAGIGLLQGRAHAGRGEPGRSERALSHACSTMQGMIVPSSKLPAGPGRLRQAAPGRGALGAAARHPRCGGTVPAESWAVLAGLGRRRWPLRSRSGWNEQRLHPRRRRPPTTRCRGERPFVGRGARGRGTAPRTILATVPSPLMNTAQGSPSNAKSPLVADVRVVGDGTPPCAVNEGAALDVESSSTPMTRIRANRAAGVVSCWRTAAGQRGKLPARAPVPEEQEDCRRALAREGRHRPPSCGALVELELVPKLVVSPTITMIRRPIPRPMKMNRLRG